MPDEIAPNAWIYCNICGDKVHSVCLLSPKWSAMAQFESSLSELRKHNKEKHGIDEPT